MLTKGLLATVDLWPPLERAYTFLDQAKAILANPEQDSGEYIRKRYFTHTAQMWTKRTTLGPLAEAFEHFCHLTDNFSAGLFRCYDIVSRPVEFGSSWFLVNHLASR